MVLTKTTGYIRVGNAEIHWLACSIFHQLPLGTDVKVILKLIADIYIIHQVCWV